MIAPVTAPADVAEEVQKSRESKQSKGIAKVPEPSAGDQWCVNGARSKECEGDDKE